MNKFKELEAIVTECDNSYYYLSSENGRIYIPIKIMHMYCDFSLFLDSKGRIKKGTKLHLVQKLDKKDCYYPDQKYYGNGGTPNTSEFPNINSNGLRESSTREFKASLTFRKEIIQTLTAFANGREKCECVVNVGVRDDGSEVGLSENDILRHKLSNENGRSDFEQNFRNDVAERTKNKDFAMHIDFRWISPKWNKNKGKLFLDIVVPVWKGGPVLCYEENQDSVTKKGSQNPAQRQTSSERDPVAYVRKGSQNKRLKMDEALEYFNFKNS